MAASTGKSAAKSTAAQPDSGSKSGSKSVAGGRVSAAKRRRAAVKPWQPAAGGLLRADMWRESDPHGLKLLVEQACRVADRLEQLGRALSGDTGSVLNLDLGRIVVTGDRPGDRKALLVEVTMKVDAAVAEERQQAKLFASLLADIGRQRAALPPDPPEEGAGARTSDLDF